MINSKRTFKVGRTCSVIEIYCSGWMSQGWPLSSRYTKAREHFSPPLERDALYKATGLGMEYCARRVDHRGRRVDRDLYAEVKDRPFKSHGL